MALGVAAFCLIAIFGLLPAGLNSNRDSIAQTTAAGLATSLISDLRSTATSSTLSPVYNLKLSGSTQKWLNEDGSVSANSSGRSGPVYRATVTVTPPASDTRIASTAWIRLTWPASIDPAVQTPSGVYETVVGLDRN